MNATKCAILCSIFLIATIVFLKNCDKTQPPDQVISITSSSTGENLEPPQTSNREVMRFLESARLERIYLTECTLDEAVKFMVKKLNANPDSGQVDFIVRVSLLQLLRKESLDIYNVTSLDALKAIGEKYQVSVKIGKQSVIFE